jgi:hypothetical protein
MRSDPAFFFSVLICCSGWFTTIRQKIVRLVFFCLVGLVLMALFARPVLNRLRRLFFGGVAATVAQAATPYDLVVLLSRRACHDAPW